MGRGIVGGGWEEKGMEKRVRVMYSIDEED